MAENTKIEWCDHTFNPWEGCTKVSPGCANCYAEARDARFHGGTAPHWGKGAPRRRTSEANWNKPLAWHKAAGKLPEITGNQEREWHRPRVFCASLADWLDPEVPPEWLADLLTLIHRTPNLDWLLLTKRPGLWRERMIAARGVMFADPLDVADQIDKWLDGLLWHNVWIGTTVEDQNRADERIPALLEIPARIRFLSCEPLLGPVDLNIETPEDLNGETRCDSCGGDGSDDIADHPEWWGEDMPPANELVVCLECSGDGHAAWYAEALRRQAAIHWVIAGGESGRHARPMHPDWARSLRDQCDNAGVPFFFKQWGEWRAAENPLHGLELMKSNPACCQAGNDPLMLYRVGKTAAGRELDCGEYNQFPTTNSQTHEKHLFHPH